MSLLSRLAVQAARAYGILSSADKTKVVADYLVVAGGGSGGSGSRGAGGGAGGLLTSTATLSTLTTYTVTVGGGGALTLSWSDSDSGVAQGTNGSNSVLSGTGLSTITATGGGGGGGNDASGTTQNGLNGGSGGGSWYNGTAGTGISGQGNNGGIGTTSSSYGSGGGGGSGGVGGNGSTTVGGNGGAGTASSISGSSVTYAGGGSGCTYNGTSAGTTTGGGGVGKNNSPNNQAGTSGTANLGGGGGAGGSGGSGIVIISYTSATPKFVGGTITTSGGKQIHTFTSSGTLSPITPITASYLVVAGGGSGGRSRAGGGGGGGLLTSSTTLYSGASYIVTVGGGGAAGNSGGTAGSNSVISGTGLTTLTATGGGFGGDPDTTAATSGGSGGGGASVTNTTGASGTSGQGNAGGNGYSSLGGGGGGGGASAVGSAGTSTAGGNGGNGTASSISGTSVTYAGGGGGGKDANSGTAGTGGTGGGGNGCVGTGANATSGTPNTGGGGGGGGGTAGVVAGVATGNGGSGIVIISYAGSQVFNGGLVTTSGGNTIHTFTSTGALTPLTNNLNNSLRFRSSASAYLSRTPSVTGNRTTFTFSFWIKRGALSAGDMFSANNAAGGGDAISFGGGSTASIFFGGGAGANIETTQVFRDPSAWYHIVYAVDTTQAVSNNRIKVYVNGNQVSAFATSTYPTQNYNVLYFNNSSYAQWIARGYSYLDGYMTDINFIDGQALEPYYFGNNDANQVWKPIQYKGTYGTNGFYLTFGNTTSTTTLGYDSSPNGNNWTCNNISLTAGTTYDAMTDVPTNTSATASNFATLNPLFVNSYTITNGNLNVSGTTANKYAPSTITLPTTGKFYFEYTCTNTAGADRRDGMGVVDLTQTVSQLNAIPNSVSYFSLTGDVYVNNSSVATYSSYTNGDIVQCAIDCDTGKVWFGKSGTFNGSPTGGTSQATTLTNNGNLAFAVSSNGASTTYSLNGSANFGQRPFSYTPPTGFVALNTYNL